MILKRLGISLGTHAHAHAHAHTHTIQDRKESKQKHKIFSIKKVFKRNISRLLEIKKVKVIEVGNLTFIVISVPKLKLIKLFVSLLDQHNIVLYPKLKQMTEARWQIGMPSA